MSSDKLAYLATKPSVDAPVLMRLGGAMFQWEQKKTTFWIAIVVHILV